jgi:hypothetical protein
MTKITISDVHTWREAAANDGWEIDKTYGNEKLESAWSATRGGWIVLALARPKGEQLNFDVASINIWGLDGLSCRAPIPYPGFDELQPLLRKCNCCGADDVETQRYSFAGRCCADCRPEMARQTERPGWTK